jgi:hypothetical protein
MSQGRGCFHLLSVAPVNAAPFAAYRRNAVGDRLHRLCRHIPFQASMVDTD